MAGQKNTSNEANAGSQTARLLSPCPADGLEQSWPRSITPPLFILRYKTQAAKSPSTRLTHFIAATMSITVRDGTKWPLSSPITPLSLCCVATQLEPSATLLYSWTDFNCLEITPVIIITSRSSVAYRGPGGSITVRANWQLPSGAVHYGRVDSSHSSPSQLQSPLCQLPYQYHTCSPSYCEPLSRRNRAMGMYLKSS